MTSNKYYEMDLNKIFILIFVRISFLLSIILIYFLILTESL